jgi:hypothetical protein
MEHWLKNEQKPIRYEESLGKSIRTTSERTREVAERKLEAEKPPVQFNLRVIKIENKPSRSCFILLIKKKGLI